MSNKIELTSGYIGKLTPAAVATDKNIGEHFVNKFMAMYRVPKEQAVAFYEREKDNFMKRITDSEELKTCTPMSIFLAFMQVGGWQLSFEGGAQADVYLIPGSRNVAPKNQEAKWVKEVVAQPSPYGEKKIRVQNGQIKDAAKPVVVYDVDDYNEFTDDNGKLKVEWTKGVRTDKSKIIGSFIRIEKPDGSHEFVTFDLSDIAKWKDSSAKKNKDKGANVMYTSNNGQIDKLFLEGKTLKHAFKGYAKVVNTPKISQDFVVDSKTAVREGFDVSEFTEDTTYTEEQQNQIGNGTDEFDQALNEHREEKEPTKVIAGADDDNEPEF
jgi:hypothetical protein